MSNHQLLDNVTHKNLRVIRDQRSGLGDDLSYTHVFIDEFRLTQADFPIFLMKNPTTAKFEAVAMFGFAEQENLFLSEQGWSTSYVPLTIRRRPFLIGFQDAQSFGGSADSPVIHIDMDSPRVSETDGDLVFLEHGGQSPMLSEVAEILGHIHQGHAATAEFIDAIMALNLVESVTIKAELADGNTYQLDNLYTVHEEALAALNAEQLDNLHTKGYLQALYMLVASSNNLSKLIALKNARLAHEIP